MCIIYPRVVACIMVDTQDLFRKLAKGATFKKEKQSPQLAVFQVI